MMEIKLLSGYQEKLQLLNDFIYLFPHLKDKIESVEIYVKKLHENAEMLQAVDGGKALGMIAFYANDVNTKCGYISLIGVHSDCTSRGIGKELLDAAYEIMRGNGMTLVRLEVDDDNLNAMRFYKSCGYRFDGKTKQCSNYMVREIN